LSTTQLDHISQAIVSPFTTAIKAYTACLQGFWILSS